MKRNVKNVLVVVLIFVITTMLFGGCYCCYCPTCPQETHPESAETIDKCSLLEWFRGLTPLATRWLMSKFYVLVSESDIEWALTQIGPWECCMSYDEITDGIHALEGYKDVPVGYAEYSNGMRVNVIICKEQGEKKAFLLTNGKIEELTCDLRIVDVVI